MSFWKKRKARDAFSQYVPPDLIQRVMASPELLRLGGEEKQLTALFSSMRGFVRLAEDLRPAELMDLMNDYLSDMTDVVFKHWGTLDKYIGDTIMAFWGAPYPQEDHAARACRAALDMREALIKLQDRWEQQGRPRIEIGVGINTGTMIVGNMGSKTRFNYTIMGGEVNLAARLEKMNKRLGTRLLIGENTCEAVRKEVLVREVEIVHIKGRANPVKIFELVGTSADADLHRDRIERFEQGLEAYHAQNWAAAIEIFEAVGRDYPQDGPTKVYIKRCQDLLIHPASGV